MRVIASRSRARIWLRLDQRQARGADATRGWQIMQLSDWGGGGCEGRVGVLVVGM